MGDCESWPKALGATLQRLDVQIQKFGMEVLKNAVLEGEGGHQKAFGFLKSMPDLVGEMAAAKTILAEIEMLKGLSQADIPEELPEFSKSFPQIVKVAALKIEIMKDIFPDLVSNVQAWLERAEGALGQHVDVLTVSLSDWKSAISKYRQGNCNPTNAAVKPTIRRYYN